ncbi:MAG: hypothetical protein DMF03_06525 [Verrucomicrobia bacterium]|nr:MAG: hypothetical protein DMF03_06525 [Verrucomicrobiota bacterium]
MADNQHENSQPTAKRRRRVWILLVFALLIIFHRPLLLGAVHWFAVRSAAKQNLRLEFRAEGNLFTALTIRNLRISPTGPAAIESADAEYLRVEYDLISLIRGRSDFLDSIDLRNARIVIDPAKVRVKAAPRPREKVTLPAVFPEWARLDNVTVIIRNAAHDFVAEEVSVDLNRRAAGSLNMTLLQLPTGEAWTRVTGLTDYKNRNLVLRDVVLNDRTRFKLVNVDASHIREHTMTLRASATLDDAPVDLETSLSEQARSLFIKSHLIARGLALASAKRLGIFSDVPVDGEVENFAFDFVGLLSAPKTWAMSGGGTIRNLQLGGATFDSAAMQVSAHDGIATIQPIELARAGSVLQLRGSIQLPDRADDLGRSPATFEVAGNDLDLGLITASTPKPVSGHAQINGTLEVRDEQVHANLKISSGPISNGQIGLQKLEATIIAAKDLRSPSPNVPWFDRLHSNATLVAEDLQNGDLAADMVSVQLEQRGNRIWLSNAIAQRGQNQIAANGTLMLPANTGDFRSQPAQIEVSITAPQLAEFWSQPSPDQMTGMFTGSAIVRWDGAMANGWFAADGSDLWVRNLAIPQLSTSGSIWRSRVFLNDLTAKLNQRDFVNAQGTFDLRGQRNFAGKVSVDIADMSTLKPLLEAAGNKTELGGTFALNWEGRGSLARVAENGSLKLTWSRGRLGNMKELQANVDASYTPAGLDIPVVFFGSDRMDFQAIVSAKGERLEISKIQLDQEKAKYAAGYISIPFIWKNVGTDEPVFPADGQVAATFQSENLDLKKLFDDFGVPAAANGFINVTMQADGTLADLRARLDVDARDLRNPKLANVDPATLRLSAETKQKTVNFAGQLKQPKIQPVDINGSAPFDAGQILRTRSFDENTPLEAKVRLPRSSVNFLRQFIPAVEQLDGDLAVDVAIGGTIAHPVLSGTGDITINVARFTNATLPALRGFQSRLLFHDNTLTLERFHGDLAGGPFTVGGRVVFTKLTEPNLDLDLRADSILIARNDSLTARADANLKATGPITSATVKGNVALTNSHFLKDIDLIPIGLPGRPAPQPIEDRPDFSITQPPMRDWKFDVAIKTKDPFSIRGNLANGGAIADLHLGGTGLHPELKGTVKLQNVEATLPFSRLEVTNGFLYFDPSDSFNPKIDLQGTSLIRDYTVRVYVYGRSLAPEAVFTSEPPLPQEEVISLLATGTTRQELSGNTSVLAGRAATLLVQQLYRKIFKKGQPTESNSIFDRLQVDLGGVDPRTGHQQATTRFKVNENWVLVGDIGVGGEFRGLVKYLIRFH